MDLERIRESDVEWEAEEESGKKKKKKDDACFFVEWEEEEEEEEEEVVEAERMMGGEVVVVGWKEEEIGEPPKDDLGSTLDPGLESERERRMSLHRISVLHHSEL